MSPGRERTHPATGPGQGMGPIVPRAFSIRRSWRAWPTSSSQPCPSSRRCQRGAPSLRGSRFRRLLRLRFPTCSRCSRTCRLRRNRDSPLRQLLAVGKPHPPSPHRRHQPCPPYPEVEAWPIPHPELSSRSWKKLGRCTLKVSRVQKFQPVRRKSPRSTSRPRWISRHSLSARITFLHHRRSLPIFSLPRQPCPARSELWTPQHSLHFLSWRKPAPSFLIHPLFPAQFHPCRPKPSLLLPRILNRTDFRQSTRSQL